MDNDVMPRSVASAIVIAVLMTSCGIGQRLTEADQAVQTFHAQLDTGMYGEIYRSAHDGFRKGGTEAESATFMRAVHEKLGSVKQSSRVNWRVHYGPDGKAITVVYETEFESGKATETFAFLCLENGLILHGYNIHSNDLITK